MGWLFTQGQTRHQLIERCSKGWNGDDDSKVTALAHRAVGNNLWVVFERSHPTAPSHRFIGLFLMQKQKGYGWGYKDIDESMGLYEVSCPLGFLDMVPEVPEPYGAAWRVRVREYHAKANQKLSIGQTITLTNQLQYTVSSIRPLTARSVDNGQVYRIPRRMLTL